MIREQTRTPAAIRPLIALAVFAGAFAVYAATAFPALPGGDAGELVGAAASGGVAHPPGFPLWLLLARLTAHLPWGALAWRENLLSAACGAGAAAVLFLAAARLTASAGAALVAAALFAFSPTVWRWAQGAEVFSLDNLLVAAVLYFAVRFAMAGEGGGTTARHEAPAARFRAALLCAFSFGLALSDHHESLFSALPLAAFVLARDPSLARGRRLLALAGAFAAGLLPYLYLPIAGAHPAAVTWGATDTLSGFWTHVLRREYGTFRLSTDAGGPGAAAILLAWGRSTGKDLGLGGAAAAAGGALILARRDWGLLAALLAAMLLPVAVFALLGNLPLTDALKVATYARFWQQPLLFACFLVAPLFAAAAARIPSRVATAVLAAFLALLLPALRFPAMDRTADRLEEDYGRAILRIAPPDALLLARGDLIVNTVRYLQIGERLRPDVRVVPDGFLALPWGRRRVAEIHPDVILPPDLARPGGVDPASLVEANFDRYPVMLCGGVEDGNPGILARWSLWPWGLCELVRPKNATPDVQAWIEGSLAALPAIPEGSVRAGTWDEVVRDDAFAARQMRALKLMDLAGHDPGRRAWLEQAAAVLDGILRQDPHPAPQFARSLAVVLGRIGTDTPEERRRTAAAWRRYLAVAPRTDPQLAAIRRELARLER